MSVESQLNYKMRKHEARRQVQAQKVFKADVILNGERMDAGISFTPRRLIRVRT